MCAAVWRSRAPERSGETALAHTRLPLAAGARALARPSRPLARDRPPCARPRKLFRAGASAGARLLRHARAPSARAPARSLRSCPRPEDGAAVEGVFFPLLTPTSLILLWLLEFEEERSRRRRGWVCRGNSHIGLALPRCSLSRAGHRAPAGQRHSQKFPPLRSAFALRMDPESHHVKPGVFQSPGHSHSSSLSFSLTVSRQSPLLIHVIPWASFPFLNTGTPQPSWPTS